MEKRRKLEGKVDKDKNEAEYVNYDLNSKISSEEARRKGKEVIDDLAVRVEGEKSSGEKKNNHQPIEAICSIKIIRREEIENKGARGGLGHDKE